MEDVINVGTGKALKNDYYRICGKTGTAQVADRGIRYSDHVYHGSFIGFFPKEDPQYTICVVLRTKKGSNNYYGGTIALPVFKEVANRLYALNMHNANTAVHLQKPQNKVCLYNLSSSNFNIINEKLGLSKLRLPEGNWVQNIQNDSLGRMSYQTTQMPKGSVPNVNGMGLREALYLLEKTGLKVLPQGRGKVTAQSIEPGTLISKGQTITLQLG
jgi:cell division protein FtsI (penicillin-binding protein 3)